ncbi:MAG: hypothetical protein HOP33_00490, partial [Verrucomicrobia bacterium]|nr:hypothetical protein [Verrucomicrobiota bacterium]
MIKAAALSIGLIALVATSITTCAQNATASNPTGTAVNEAVRREHDLRELRARLGEARDAVARKDVPKAAAIYTAAHGKARSIGAAHAPAEAAEALAGLTSTCLELANRARTAGNLVEAEKKLAVVLAADPKNMTALEMKRGNDKAIAESKGRVPSLDAQERFAAAHEEKVAADQLVQDAGLLMEAGKLKEAEAKIVEALKKDPQNQAAFYYQNLISEKKYRDSDRKREVESRKSMVELEEEWAPSNKRLGLPQPNPAAKSELIHTGKGRQQIVSKLNKIHFDTAGYDGLPLNEVVRILSEEARKRDPDKRGVNFIINPNGPPPVAGATVIDPATGAPVPAPPAEAVDVNAIAIKLSPPLSDVRLADVLDAIVRVSEKPLRYSIEEYAVVFSLKGSEIVPLFTRTFRVDPNTFRQGLENVQGVSFDVQSSSSSGGGGG